MKIATWNVNSINARLESVIRWIQINNPDILLLQETKCEESKFPYESLSDFNYNIAISGQKSYNGVSIFSKYQLEDIKTDFDNNPCPEEARFVQASCSTPYGYMQIMSVYVPNGTEIGSPRFEIKTKFFPALKEYLRKINNDELLLIGGDFNVAPFDIDVYSKEKLENSIGFTLPERKLMRELINAGFFDLYRLHNPTKQEFSWWDYRAGGFSKNRGMRLDTFLGNAYAADKFKSCCIDIEARGWNKPSDHTPVVVTF